jgi:predicted Zn-ribbon and HTH transcriptional regulator
MEKRFINYYECSECGTNWQNEDDCTCNDRCPNCDTEIEPTKSEDITLTK